MVTLRSTWRVLSILSAVSCSSAAFGQASITDLGLLPGYIESHARGLSADGSIVVGFSGSEDFHTGRAFRWSAHGLTDLGALPGTTTSYATAISADRQTIVGYSDSASRAVRWTSSGIESLGTLPNWSGWKALAVSADGSTIVGFGVLNFSKRAFRWTPAAGIQDLIALTGSQLVDAYGVSADGQFIVGTDAFASGLPYAYRWSLASGVEHVGSFPGGSDSWAYGINADGSVVIGADNTSDGTEHGFRRDWSQPTHDLGVIPGSLPQIRGTVAMAVSADGLSVVGNGTRPISGYQGAFLWTQATGTVDLNIYLPAHGADLTGWDLDHAFAMSADGSVIAGDGVHNGVHTAWIARLHPACGSADFNGDGDVGTDQDIDDFFACLSGTCCPSCGSPDFNGDSDVGTDADIDAFFRVLAGGSC